MTMNQPVPSPPTNYFTAALYNQYNMILLAGSASFSAALASWAPLLSGLVGEALWLATGPRLSAFRRHTDARIQAASATRAATPLPPAAVPPEYAERAAAVQSTLKRVEDAFGIRSDLGAPD